MNTARSGFKSLVLALLAAVLASLAWHSAFAQASRPVSNLVVPIAGTVQVGAETVAFSGQARVTSILVTDPDFGGPPSVILAVDLLNVFGVGQTTGARYVARGEEKLLRLLESSDLIEVAFPVFRFPVRPGATALDNPLIASIALDFDGGNGQLREGNAKFSTPNFPGLGLGQ